MNSDIIFIQRKKGGSKALWVFPSSSIMNYVKYRKVVVGNVMDGGDLSIEASRNLYNLFIW